MVIHYRLIEIPKISMIPCISMVVDIFDWHHCKWVVTPEMPTSTVKMLLATCRQHMKDNVAVFIFTRVLNAIQSLKDQYGILCMPRDEEIYLAGNSILIGMPLPFAKAFG